MREKGLAPIIIVILIALGIGGYLYYQNQSRAIPTPSQQTTTSTDETANWKTYANQTFNFSVNYPDGWIYEETIASKELTYIGFSPIKDSSSIVTIYIHNKPGSESMSLEETANIDCNKIELGYCISLKNSKDLKVDGVDAKRIDDMPPGPVPSEEIYFKKGLILFRILRNKMDFPSYTPTQQEQIFNKMLSTFKFTE